jgi:hypothetical protein
VPPGWEFDDLVFDYGAIPSSLSINENTVKLALRVVNGQAQVEYSMLGDREYFNTKPYGINLEGVKVSDDGTFVRLLVVYLFLLIGPNAVDAFYVFGDPILYVRGNLRTDTPIETSMHFILN